MANRDTGKAPRKGDRPHGMTERPPTHEPRDTDEEQIRMPDFETLEPVFRTHFNKRFADTGLTFEEMTPAYLYGYEAGLEARYEDQEWEVVAPDLEEEWQARGSNLDREHVLEAMREGYYSAQGGRQQRSERNQY